MTQAAHQPTAGEAPVGPVLIGGVGGRTRAWLLVFASLALATVVAAVTVAITGAKVASSEEGPLESAQMAAWIASAVLAAGAAFWMGRRTGRGALALLATGAMVVAAREADLHERLNPRGLGDWGVRFRIDWWLSAEGPVGPRLAGAAVFVLISVAAVHIVRRVLPDLRHEAGVRRQLAVPVLASAALMATGWVLDDLLRYRVPLRPAQVCEETVELAASLVYLGVVLVPDAYSSSPANTPRRRAVGPKAGPPRAQSTALMRGAGV